MPYKISIIIPVYNGEKSIENTLNSLIKQTIGIENLQIIIVNDKSTDNTQEIIETYIKDYPNIELINLDKNIGAAYGPKNIALDYVKSSYIMFLDADDSYELNSCEVLYNTIEKENVDIVYGRYKRIYPDVDKDKYKNHYINNKNELIQKSHSAFKDRLNDYTDDIIDNINLRGISGFIWKNIISYFIYGKTYKNPNISCGVYDEIYLEKLSDNINILRSLPSFWTKIYRTDLILKNNIKFPEVISAEDLNFLMEAYFHAKGIIFLNNQFVYNYYMRDSEDDKSITKDVSFKLVHDSLIGYSKCSSLCNEYKFNDVEIILNPFLLNFISLVKKSNLTKDEKNIIRDTFNKFKKEYKCGIKGKLILFVINRLLN